jgi:hypothetical protein
MLRKYRLMNSHSISYSGLCLLACSNSEWTFEYMSTIRHSVGLLECWISPPQFLYESYASYLMNDKSCPTIRHGGAWGERRNSCHSFLTSALGGSEWSGSLPGSALPPGKVPQVPIEQEAGWAPEPVWTQKVEEKILSPLPVIEPRSPGRPVRNQTL